MEKFHDAHVEVCGTLIDADRVLGLPGVAVYSSNSID